MNESDGPSSGAAPRVPTWTILAGLYLLSVVVRLWYQHIPAYGDEGAFYYTARHLTTPPPNLHDLYIPDESPLSALVFYRPDPPIFWYRPMHFLALWPAAQFGFDAYRTWNLVLCATIPPLAALLLRVHGVRWPLAGGAAVALAIAPFMAVWSVITVPDALMTAFFIAGLSAWTLRRSAVSAVLFLCAVWTKEVALVGVLAVFASSLWARRAAGDAVWPLHLTRRESFLLVAIALSPAPLFFALTQGGWLPGGRGHAGMGEIVDAVFLLPWLAPFAIGGLLHPRTRWLAGMCLVYPAFFVLYEAMGRFTNIWYYVLPTSMGVMGAAAGLEAWARSVRGAPKREAVNSGVAAFLMVLVLVLAFAPTGPAKSEWLQPFSHRNQDNLAEARSYESARDRDRDAAIARLDAGPGRSIFSIDLYAGDVYHPLLTSGADVTVGQTALVEVLGQDLRPWSDAIENRTSVTVLKVHATRLNEAVRAAYAECTVWAEGAYVVIDGPSCNGRHDRLVASYESDLEG